MASYSSRSAAAPPAKLRSSEGRRWVDAKIAAPVATTVIGIGLVACFDLELTLDDARDTRSEASALRP